VAHQALGVKQDCQIVVGIGVRWVKFQAASITRRSFLELAELFKRNSPLEVNNGIFRKVLKSLVEQLAAVHRLQGERPRWRIAGDTTSCGHVESPSWQLGQGRTVQEPWPIGRSLRVAMSTIAARPSG
jgi:hypothetical protein